VAVQRVSATRNVELTLHAFPTFSAGLFSRVIPRSLVTPADARGAIAAAAVNFASLQQEPFSSEGPALGPGGKVTGPAGIAKPDVTGFDGVTVSTPPAFFGTSAAAPHVAGAAALIKAFYPQMHIRNQRRALEALVNDLGVAGRDSLFGEGVAELGLQPIDFDGDGILDDGNGDDLAGLPASGACATGQGSGCDDNCPLVPNAGQQGVGGIGAAPTDGIGNACQCGDVSANGIVSGTDSLRINQAVLNLFPMIGTNGAIVSRRDASPFFLVGRCDVDASVGGACTATDA
jgi:subtilisin family serine protease